MLLGCISSLCEEIISFSAYSKEMFSFQSCSSVPVKGGRLLAGEAWGGGVGGLVEVDGRIVWGGDDGAYILDEN